MASASGDRFYLMEFRNRPVYYGDIGSLLKISGVVVTGGGTQATLMLPGMIEALDHEDCHNFELTTEEWSDFIHRSDDPEILVGNAKIFQRKLRYEISGAVQQKVWAADGFMCVYCGAKMGHALMTIDHFQPLELGGANDTTNFVTACKKCNKDKASEDPQIWCERRGLQHSEIAAYLKLRLPIK